jgi:hypothetical protein
MALTYVEISSALEDKYGHVKAVETVQYLRMMEGLLNQMNASGDVGQFREKEAD